MTSKAKQNLRYQKAFQRLNKEVYSKNTFEAKLVKLEQNYERLDKWSNQIWAELYSKGFTPGQLNSQFNEQFELLNTISKLIAKCSKSIETIEKKGYDLKQALINHKNLNQGRLSQSY